MDDVPGFHTHVTEMRIPGFKAKVMLNNDSVTAQFGKVRGSDNTIGGNPNWIGDVGPQVNALVEALDLGNGMLAFAEFTGDDS